VKFTKTEIEGLVIVEPTIFEDDRGYFYESYNQNEFESSGIFPKVFVQDNQSKSSKGVLRGLHFQKPPFAQGKLVRVLSGAVLDVAIDLRKNSKTYGHHFSIELTGDNHKMFWVPPGFAHGFLTLEDDTIFCYKCTNPYHKQSEVCILWNDPDLNIDWKIDNPIISEKDQEGIELKNFNNNIFTSQTNK
tara:strand:+ start:297 stop:863 length:567 start_codon:yes stop_codon:yes gene_type:complete